MSLRQIDIEKCHRLLLKIAETFDRLCRRQAIPYYMLGGTMLGAIRHGGFIPWDDDMDFGIPRPYFEMFIGIARQELPKELQLITRHDSPALRKGFLKIQLRGSRLYETVFGQREDSFYNGLAIDIFPLDGADTSTQRGRRMIRKAFLLQRIQEARLCSLDIRTGLKRQVARFLQALPLDDEQLDSRIERLIQEEDYAQSSEIANFYGHWKRREIVDKAVFGSPTDYPFEHLRLQGVERYDDYLHSLYDDYRKLPPKEEQIAHTDHIYVSR